MNVLIRNLCVETNCSQDGCFPLLFDSTEMQAWSWAGIGEGISQSELWIAELYYSRLFQWQYRTRFRSYGFYEVDSEGNRPIGFVI